MLDANGIDRLDETTVYGKAFSEIFNDRFDEISAAITATAAGMLPIFTNAAARDAAIPVPTTGMQCILNTHPGVTFLYYGGWFQQFPHGSRVKASVQSIAIGPSLATLLFTDAPVLTAGVEAATNGLKVRLPGRYLLEGTATFASNATGDRLGGFMVNGGPLPSQGIAAAAMSAALQRLEIQRTAVLAGSDIITFGVYQTSGGALNVTAADLRVTRVA